MTDWFKRNWWRVAFIAALALMVTDLHGWQNGLAMIGAFGLGTTAA